MGDDWRFATGNRRTPLMIQGRGELGRRAPGPVLQGLIAFVIYLVVFILGFGQALITHLNQPSVGQVEVDPNFYIWAWRWWPYAVTHGLNPLYSLPDRGAGGVQPGVGDHLALGGPALCAGHGRVRARSLSFNLTLLLAPPASAWAAFVAARRLTGKFWAALPAGVVYGFNVYTLDHEVSGQPNLTVTLLLPLMVYLVLLWWDGTLRRTGYVIWMTLAIALEFYTFVEALRRHVADAGWPPWCSASGRRPGAAAQGGPARPAHRHRLPGRHGARGAVPDLRARQLPEHAHQAGAVLLARPVRAGAAAA